MTLLRYPQSQKIRKARTLKVVEARKAKAANEIPKIGKGNLCLREKSINFKKNNLKNAN
jgi:hypothetical protein